MITKKDVFLAFIVSLLVLTIPQSVSAQLLKVCQKECSFTSIQAAIDDASPGDVVKIKPGTYEENLTVNKDLTVEGEGKEKVQVTGKTNGHPTLLIGPKSVKVTVRDLTLKDARGAKCENKEKGVCPRGISARGSAIIRVRELIITGNSAGIRLTDYVNATIEATTVKSNSLSGIKLLDSTTASVSDVEASGHKFYGIGLEDSSQASVINSRFAKNRWGVFIGSSGQATLKDNIVVGNDISGIHLLGSAQTTMTANEINDNGEVGVSLSDSVQATVKNNFIRSHGTGIAIYRPSEFTGKLKGFGNTLSKNDRTFLGLSQATEKALQSKTSKVDRKVRATVNGKGFHLIQSAITFADPGDTVRVKAGTHPENLTINKNLVLKGLGQERTRIKVSDEDQPVLLVGPSDVQVKVKGVKLIGSGGVCDNWQQGYLSVGVSVKGKAKITINDSTITSNCDGIRLFDSSRAIISQSTISDNGRYGIRIFWSSRAEFRGNEIIGNNQAGIFSNSNKGIRGSHNRMRDNGVDLVGDISDKLREPLKESTEEKIVFPDKKYPTLQDAVDALVSGGTILIEEGRYRGGITIGKDITIKSKSNNKPVLEGKGYGVISRVKGGNLKLQGLMITGEIKGIVLESDSSARVIDCLISDMVNGIWLMDTSQAKIIDSKITSNKGGILLNSSSQAVLKNNNITDNSDFGICLYDASRNTLQGFGNQLSGNGSNYGPKSILLDITAKTQRERASLNGEGYNLIQSAILAAKPGDTVYIRPGTYEESLEINKDLTVVGEGEDKVIIKPDKKPHSVVLVGPSDIDVTIKKVTLEDTHHSKCKSARVCPNGIYLDGNANLKLENVTIRDSGKEGISVRDNAKVTVLNSTINDNRRRGMWLAGSASAVIKDSSIINNTNYGIEFANPSFHGTDEIDSSSQLTIVNSLIKNNKWGGLQLEDLKLFNIQDSDIKNNGDGIILSEVKKAKISGNEIEGNGTGIRLHRFNKATLTNNSILKNKVGMAFKKSQEFDCNITGHGNRLIGNKTDFKGFPELLIRGLTETNDE